MQIVGAAIARFGAIEPKRNPEVLPTAQRKLLGHNPYYRVGLAVKLNRFRYYIGVTRELAPPKRIAEQREMRMAGLVLLSAEDAAEYRRNSKYRKQASRGTRHRNLHRRAIRASQVRSVSE